MTFGSLGEALAPASPDVPYVAQVAVNSLGAAIYAALGTLAILSLRNRPVDRGRF